MFNTLTQDGVFLGYTLLQKGRFFFFGSRHVAREDLARLFPRYRFCFLKQVHGRAVFPATPTSEITADGHFTATPGLALVVQSADCLPLLISSPGQVVAIHAGWRGVAQNIVGAVPEMVKGFGPDFGAMGPHIGAASFEVGADVALKLIAAAPDKALKLTQASPGAVDGKVLFDLKSLVTSQLRASFGLTLAISECCEDTRTNTLFHSYRRDGASAGRQFSFVVINP